MPANTKVFSPDKAFNVMDIAECHAISAELYHLRAFGDEAGLTARLEGAKKSAFRLAMSVAIDATKDANDLGYSPNQMQILSLLSCSASLDVVDDSATVRNLEDELPWWRFATKDIKSPETFHRAATNLQYLSTMQLAGQESKWFQYRMRAANKPRGAAPSNEDRSHVLSSLLSFGLELQVRAIHQGAVLNTRYLATLLYDNLKVSYPKDFVRLSHDDWANQLKHDIPLVEYNDNLRFRPTPLDDMYPPDSAVRQTMFFNEMEQESIQLLALLLTGASARAAFAVYDKKSIPSSQVLLPKLESYLQQTEVAEGLVKVLANAFDHGQIFPIQRSHLRIMPPSAENNKYI
ncbi:hypothetical protein GTP46_26930 [Duganella sp. FT135W]|uniref:Uncharacterized protein n=1 Tax=Duganella flavida TaxID=2692175 RepID=A0A6L8KGV7_9BURK|nr:hypothetical protein [Duganella flavida]MYM26270.1 hypothetical protein [Duganella flavida]